MSFILTEGTQYANTLCVNATNYIVRDSLTDSSYVSYVDTNNIPSIFGAVSWKHSDSSFQVKLGSSLTTALSLKTSIATFSGVVNAPLGIQVRNWKLVMDTASNFLLFQYFESGSWITKMVLRPNA